MLVLGVDPGLTRCGYCCVEWDAGLHKAVGAGVIRTSKDDSAIDRLAEIQREITALIREYSPEVVAIERIFFHENLRTAVGVAQASGIVIAEAFKSGAEVREFSPNEVKQAVCGYGGADKQQVSHMVQMLLSLQSPLRPADVSDAAAVALCFLALRSPSALAAAPVTSQG